MLSTITSGIKNRLTTVLGNGFSELSYTYDLGKNSFKGSYSKFGIVPLSGEETSGVNGYVTVRQTFEVTLTEAFLNKPLSDNSQKEKVIELQEKLLLIYKDLIKTKAGTPSAVSLVSNLQIQAPQFLELAVIQKATIQVQFRTQI